jgi:HEAT repeat protein
MSEALAGSSYLQGTGMSDELDAVLIELGDEDRPVHSVDLGQLSDLARAEVAEFRVAWEQLSTERRRGLVASMVDQAETNIHMNFHAVLRACLTDPDGQVRRLAIEGLWEDERANLVQPLITILANDADATVRAAAAISLGRFVLLGELEEIPGEPARAAEQALRETWFRHGEVNDVRRRALEGLAYTSNTGINELIQNAYYDEDALMRQSAVFSMGRSNHPRWARIVLEELGSTEPEMRFEAAQAAGEMGLKSAVQILIRRLEDVDIPVREAAVAALGKIGGPAAKRALEGLIGGSDEPLAHAAEDALEELNFNTENLDNLMLDVEERALRNRATLEDLEDDLEDELDEGASRDDEDLRDLEEDGYFEADFEDVGDLVSDDFELYDDEFDDFDLDGDDLDSDDEDE